VVFAYRANWADEAILKEKKRQKQQRGKKRAAEGLR
jgi:hypothetical protein